MKYITFILAVFFSFSACKTSEKTPELIYPPKPSWVSNKPIDVGQYVGVGMAYKQAGADYIAIAKNNALNDLASEISVNISSSSLFYQIEQDNTLREEFQANTRLKSKENLAGYTLVSTYENENEYWVYYTLNKAEYQQIKDERLQGAIALSKQYFTTANQFYNQNQLADCIKFQIRALAAMRDYLAEPVQTTWQNTEVFWVPTLYGALQNSLSSISIFPKESHLRVKRGESVSGKDLAFTAKNEANKPVAGLPIYVYYSAGRINNNQLYTNAQGAVELTLAKVASTNQKEYVQANINIVALAKEATEDAFVRKLVGKLSGAEARVEIEILRPKIFITSSEKNLDIPMSSLQLSAAYKQQFVAAGFLVVQQKSQADLVLKIDANTRATGQKGNFYTAALQADIQFVDERNNLLYQKAINGYTGVQISAQKAGEDAYAKLATEIEKRFFREMRRKVFDE